MSDLSSIETPELRAQMDYQFGGNQSTNPYPKDSNPRSDFQRYSWEMHRQAAREFDLVAKDYIRRKASC